MKIDHLLIATIMLASASPGYAQSTRWYSDDQIQHGKQIFKRKCAKCHGDNAEGKTDWRTINEDGEYPPPPLNGSAYAWHYSLDQLRKQVQVGSNEIEGDMPSFEGKLNAKEIDAVIAFFQSTWSDITYIVWKSKQFQPVAEQDAKDGTPRRHMGTHWLAHHLSSAKITPGEPRKTPVKSIREVRVGDEYVYLSEDGRYAFTGDMIDLRDGSNLTRLNQVMETKTLLQTYSRGNMLVYPAKGNEKTQLTIFTDTSCGYCRKLHREVPQLQSEGVTVQVIPYPRRGPDSRGYSQLNSIWCSGSPKQALSAYVENKVLPDMKNDCKKPHAVNKGYRLGNKLGISGTPLMVMENGERIRGYKPASEVIEKLNTLTDKMAES